jgi:hypothetical protein
LLDPDLIGTLSPASPVERARSLAKAFREQPEQMQRKADELLVVLRGMTGDPTLKAYRYHGWAKDANEQELLSFVSAEEVASEQRALSKAIWSRLSSMGEGECIEVDGVFVFVRNGVSESRG